MGTSTTPLRVLVRADGGSRCETGMGHVYKCLWLLDALAHERTASAVFVMRFDPAATSVVRRHGHEVVTIPADESPVEGWRATVDIACERKPDLIVVDVLATRAEHVRSLRGRGALLVHFDDSGDGARCADLVVNALVTNGDGASPTLSGIPFERMAPQFAAYRARPRVVRSRVASVVVMLGGCDYFDEMPRYLRAVSGAGEFRVTAIVGPAFTNRRAIEKAARELPGRIEVAVDPEDMARRLWEADLAVSAGGSTVFQLAAVGTPAVIVSQYHHQLRNATWVAAAGTAVDLGLRDGVTDASLAEAVRALDGDARRRQSMSEAGRRLVDGQGCRRVALAILDRLRMYRCTA